MCFLLTQKRRSAWRVRAAFERPGTSVGPFDMFIGIHASAEGLIVVTDNVREF
jgi:tRNA(fMet)-specific endonuclease VapC